MNHSPAVCLRLLTDLSTMQDHHCSLCLFFHDTDGQCKHNNFSWTQKAPSVSSDSSFYTACTSGSTRSDASGSSIDTVKARNPVTGPRRNPSLRRKTSPTEMSLRDLRTKHAEQSLKRTKKSEEQLQHVYEAQILAYLNGPFIDLGSIVE